MSETALMREMQIDASQLGARLFRQNSGMGWIGKAEKFNRAKTITVHPGDVVIRKARAFHAGFEGLSDLGGWSQLLIGPEHLGQTLAVYLQTEVKKDAPITEAQMRWIAAVNKAGGIAGVVRSHDDLVALISSKSRSNG